MVRIREVGHINGILTSICPITNIISGVGSMFGGVKLFIASMATKKTIIGIPLGKLGMSISGGLILNGFHITINGILDLIEALSGNDEYEFEYE